MLDKITSPIDDDLRNHVLRTGPCVQTISWRNQMTPNIRAFLIASVCQIALAPVLAHATNGSACPYSSWKSDGCSSTTGSFLIAPYYGAANFFKFAAQSGQTWSGGA